MIKIFYLIGFPGCGKSSYGKKIKPKLYGEWIDLDSHIEYCEQKEISTIFEQSGESIFREKEAFYLRQLTESYILENKKKVIVISCGGGTPCFGGNHEYMKTKGKTIFVNTPFSVILERLINRPEKRPLIQGVSTEERIKKIQELYKSRLPEYQSADFEVSGLPPIIISQLLNLVQMAEF